MNLLRSIFSNGDDEAAAAPSTSTFTTPEEEERYIDSIPCSKWRSRSAPCWCRVCRPRPIQCTNEAGCRARQCQPHLSMARMPRQRLYLYYHQDPQIYEMQLCDLRWSVASAQWLLEVSHHVDSPPDDTGRTEPLFSWPWNEQNQRGQGGYRSLFDTPESRPKRRIMYGVTLAVGEQTNVGLIDDVRHALVWDREACDGARSLQI
jgi:hypothetical protein